MKVSSHSNHARLISWNLQICEDFLLRAIPFVSQKFKRAAIKVAILIFFFFFLLHSNTLMQIS